MIWSDCGYLLSKNKFGENSIIAEFFTENHGKISGAIYGATSKKIKKYLVIDEKSSIESRTSSKRCQMHNFPLTFGLYYCINPFANPLRFVCWRSPALSRRFLIDD